LSLQKLVKSQVWLEEQGFVGYSLYNFVASRSTSFGVISTKLLLQP
jgi:hypothetical protein